MGGGGRPPEKSAPHLRMLETSSDTWAESAASPAVWAAARRWAMPGAATRATATDQDSSPPGTVPSLAAAALSARAAALRRSNAPEAAIQVAPMADGPSPRGGDGGESDAGTSPRRWAAGSANMARCAGMPCRSAAASPEGVDFCCCEKAAAAAVRSSAAAQAVLESEAMAHWTASAEPTREAHPALLQARREARAAMQGTTVASSTLWASSSARSAEARTTLTRQAGTPAASRVPHVSSASAGSMAVSLSATDARAAAASLALTPKQGERPSAEAPAAGTEAASLSAMRRMPASSGLLLSRVCPAGAERRLPNDGGARSPTERAETAPTVTAREASHTRVGGARASKATPASRGSASAAGSPTSSQAPSARSALATAAYTAPKARRSPRPACWSSRTRSSRPHCVNTCTVKSTGAPVAGSVAVQSTVAVDVTPDTTWPRRVQTVRATSKPASHSRGERRWVALRQPPSAGSSGTTGSGISSSSTAAFAKRIEASALPP
mmetsp:Transcript_23140/g.87576  ORF Transcript_23140/g.87576 Transcript_23140/m.87576 type:complete len:499 (+) Transcript_23140:300-1796(+)